jgi:hypothetical protein
MNANTACKIREAIDQAVRNGESEWEIRCTFDAARKGALIRLYEEKLAKLRAS